MIYTALPTFHALFPWEFAIICTTPTFIRLLKLSTMGMLPILLGENTFR